MVLWTPEHAKTLLPATVIMILLAIGLRFLLKNKSEAIRMIPIQIIAVVLFALEVGKQIYSVRHGYDLYHLPFHFCSMFIFMLPIMAFYKGKYMQQVRGITAALCMSMSLILLIYPDLIYSAGNILEFSRNYLSFHTVAFHNLVLFASMLIPALAVHQPQRKASKSIFFFMIGFCAISATMAQLLKTNFNNFYVCNIAPLEAVRQAVENACGAVPAMILYVLIVSALDVLVVLGSYQLYLLVRRLFCGKPEAVLVS
jgi:hypothetical protein